MTCGQKDDNGFSCKLIAGHEGWHVCPNQSTWAPGFGADDDPVNNPLHYISSAGNLQAIDVIESFDLGFHLGAAVKYILRAGKKGDAIEDLRKALWFIERDIKRRTK